MNLPLHPLANASRSIIKPVNVESPEAVGPATAVDDSTTGQTLHPGQEPPAPLPSLPDAPKAEAESLPYSGGDRRHLNRRGSSQLTTLDTRKEGTDRRRKSRINLEV